MMILRFFHQLLCRHRDQYLKTNKYGFWLECPECGWESPGVQIREREAV